MYWLPVAGPRVAGVGETAQRRAGHHVWGAGEPRLRQHRGGGAGVAQGRAGGRGAGEVVERHRRHDGLEHVLAQLVELELTLAPGTLAGPHGHAAAGYASRGLAVLYP